MSSRWLRLNVDWHLSDWLIVLSAESRLAWVQLLCHVKTHGFSGEAKAIPAQAAERLWFVNEPSIRQMLTAAEKSGALEIKDGKWIVTKWRQYQGDDTNADRQRRYRERQRGAESQQVRAKDVFKRDGNTCLKCGATENLVVDHVIPLAAGGDGTLQNLQTLCRDCNGKKSDFVTGALRYGNEVTPTETETETETIITPSPPKGAAKETAVEKRGKALAKLLPWPDVEAVCIRYAKHKSELCKSKPWYSTDSLSTKARQLSHLQKEEFIALIDKVVTSNWQGIPNGFLPTVNGKPPKQRLKGFEPKYSPPKIRIAEPYEPEKATRTPEEMKKIEELRSRVVSKLLTTEDPEHEEKVRRQIEEAKRVRQGK